MLVRVTTAVVVVPTGTFPNVSTDGFSSAFITAATPVPLIGITVSLPIPSTRMIFALTVASAAGVNFAVSLHDALGAIGLWQSVD